MNSPKVRVRPSGSPTVKSQPDKLPKILEIMFCTKMFIITFKIIKVINKSLGNFSKFTAQFLPRSELFLNLRKSTLVNEKRAVSEADKKPEDKIKNPKISTKRNITLYRNIFLLAHLAPYLAVF